MRVSFGVWITLTLLGFQAAAAQETAWLSDEQAREVAKTAIHFTHPEPCYSTYRNERLESLVVSLRANRIFGNKLNNSVYVYRVASDVCEYVIEKDGKLVLMSLVSMDCCDYGFVAVDRASAKSYWFTGEKKADIFKEFARDEKIQSDSPEPRLLLTLYRELVWSESGDNEIRGIGQLREVVQQNFRSAYSPDERDNVWERKFARWWRHFRSSTSRIELETKYEQTSKGTRVLGYAFQGFELTIPRSALPPRGNPTLFQWAILVTPDGTVERLPSKVIYSSR